jgi:hypothetical protein
MIARGRRVRPRRVVDRVLTGRRDDVDDFPVVDG